MDNNEEVVSTEELKFKIEEMQECIEKFGYDSIALKYLKMAQQQNVNFVPKRNINIAIDDLVNIGNLLRNVNTQNIVSIFISYFNSYERHLQEDFEEAVQKREAAQKKLDELLKQLTELESRNLNFDTMDSLFSKRSYKIKHGKKDLNDQITRNSYERQKLDKDLEALRLEVHLAKEALDFASFNPTYYSSEILEFFKENDEQELR